MNDFDSLPHLNHLKRTGQLFTTDYPYHPKRRDLSNSPFIRALINRFQSERLQYKELLCQLARYTEQLRRIPFDARANTVSPQWNNDFIPGLDAVTLYGLVAMYNPSTYMEVGSGNSTKFVRQAIRDCRLRTKIVSIDPRPSTEIDAICDEIHRVALEDADLSVFDSLSDGDVLFIDNSHRAFMNSDVTVFFMEVLGRLPRNVIYGLHDIHLPNDYPNEWASRHYNEQYLLACYLFGGANGDTIVMPNAFVSLDAELTSILNGLWKAPEVSGINGYGGAFWLRKS